MLLTRYNQKEFEPVAFGDLVNSFFKENYHAGERVSNFSPKVDVIETKENFELQFLVPGISKEEIDLSIEKGKLTVSGERKKEKEEEGLDYKLVESGYGTFKRSFQLPENIDEENIEGSYSNGILKVKIPKVEIKSSLKQIVVK